MAFFGISVNDQAIDPITIKEMKLSFDLNQPLLSGKLLIKDPLQSLFTSIYVGSKVDITTYDSDGNKLNTYKYGIMSCNKVSDSDGLCLDTYEVELKDYWFFNQRLFTTGHFGTVSQIMKGVLALDRYHSKTKILPTTDQARIRYQLATTNTDFLSSIAKYAISDKSPVFFHTTTSNSLRLISLKALMNESPVKKASLYTGQIAEVDNSKLPILKVYSWASYGEVYGVQPTTTVIPAISHLLEKDTVAPNIPVVNDSAIEFKQLANLPSAVALGKIDVPANEWVATQINDIERESQEEQQLVIIAPDFIDSKLDLGNLISAQPLSSEHVGLYESGRYLVAHVDFMLSKERVLIAKVLLTRKEPLQ